MVRRAKNYQTKARHPTDSGDVKKIVNSGYSEGGASRSKSTLAAYNPIKSSAQADVDVNLSTLRARSSDLYCNTPIGAAALNTPRNAVIGAGLKLSPKIDYLALGMTQEEAKEWQRNTRREFSLWADGVDCDLYRKHNFYDLQDIVYLNYLIDGDSWAAFKYRKPTGKNPYCLRLQLFEASRVCNPNSCSNLGMASYETIVMKNPANGNDIINGVEIDRDGAVVAYWIANKVPYDLVNTGKQLYWVRVEAFGKRTGMPNVLQISHEERPEQYRGVPYLAPVIEVIKQVCRYTSAELMAAVIKAYFAIFLTSKESNTVDVYEALDAATDGRLSFEEKREILNGINLDMGSVNLLPDGVDVKAVDGSRTMSTFEPFTSTLLTQIGAANNVSADVIMSRFQASYSASRAALMQAAATFKTRRTWFVRDFCQPVYEAWLAEAVAIGRVKAPGFGDEPQITKAWCRAEWFGPTMGLLDPVKEITSAALKRKYGFSTGEREAAEISGTDYDDNIAQLAAEKLTWEAHGLEVPVADNTGSSSSKGGETNE
ncbi:MAG: phage portal protein [Phascolarctobacterium sp.]